MTRPAVTYLGIRQSEITAGGTITVTWTSPTGKIGNTTMIILPTPTSTNFPNCTATLPQASTLEIQVPLNATPGIVSFEAIDSDGDTITGINLTVFQATILNTTTSGSEHSICSILPTNGMTGVTDTTSTGSPSDPSQSSSKPSESSISTQKSDVALSPGKIAGIAIGAFIFFVILVILLIFWKRCFRASKKSSDNSIVPITCTQTSSVDPVSIINPFGEAASVLNPEEKAILEGGSWATTPSDSSESGNHTGRYLHNQTNLNPTGTFEKGSRVTTPTASSESGTVPEYPVGIVIPPREKEEQSNQDVAAYGGLTLQQMEELHEQRKKMRDLIEVLKERRASVSSMAKSQIDDLEKGTCAVIRFAVNKCHDSLRIGISLGNLRRRFPRLLTDEKDLN
ncbi:hypothetical protein BDQ17DRAFT_1460084 [Cyathus striatus]|nr:hypothetical protein BDQ17DRAFT_1460084 [Cyathus striatus]